VGSQDISVHLSFATAVREVLLRKTGLSAAARDAVERPFDATLTVAVAGEILEHCQKLELASAAEIAQIALDALSSANGHYAVNGHSTNGAARARH
jgi:hypothetical protein